MSTDRDRWRPHPQHGLAPGREPPLALDVYVELTPADTRTIAAERIDR